MASILKVDTLQKPDGSTPTAADLGIDVAGSVVQVARHEWVDHTNCQSQSIIDATGSAFTYTPKYANSVLVIQADIQGNVNGDSSVSSPSGKYHIIVNGSSTSVTTSATYAHENYLSIGGGTAADNWFRYYRSTHYQVSSTSPVTIKLGMQLYTSGTSHYFRCNHTTNLMESSITVYEIAQ